MEKSFRHAGTDSEAHMSSSMGVMTASTCAAVLSLEEGSGSEDRESLGHAVGTFGTMVRFARSEIGKV